MLGTQGPCRVDKAHVEGHRAQVEVPRAVLEAHMCEKYGPAEVFKALATQRTPRDVSHGK